MDEQVMLAWVEEVLAPYVATAPEDIILLLILDSYQCHMMASVCVCVCFWPPVMTGLL
jgi:hypothetical protein